VGWSGGGDSAPTLDGARVLDPRDAPGGPMLCSLGGQELGLPHRQRLNESGTDVLPPLLAISTPPRLAERSELLYPPQCAWGHRSTRWVTCARSGRATSKWKDRQRADSKAGSYLVAEVSESVGRKHRPVAAAYTREVPGAQTALLYALLYLARR
jgi:hypothetical protein